MRRVLVIQDNPTEAEQVRLALESDGFEVEVATDADRGLERFRTASFDLVMSEIQTDGMSGFELCREIKSEARGEVPVVLLTSLDGPLDIVRGLEAGAEDYIIKPCPPDRLAGRVRAILSSSDPPGERERREKTSDSEATSRALLQCALDSLPDAVAVFDSTGRISVVNRAWQDLPASIRLSGDRPGANYLEACHWAQGTMAAEARAMAEAIREVLADRRSEISIERLCESGGLKRWFWVHINRLWGEGGRGVVVACRDITERRRAEETLQRTEGELRELQKLETVSRLASGAAHDFNNLLTAIHGYTDLVLSNLEPESPLRRDLEEIKRAGQRAASLTRQFLAFTKRQVVEPREVDLNAVLGDLRRMLQRLLGEDVELVTALAPGLGKIKADPGLIEQVILNLSLHAREVAPEDGKLTIETGNVYLDQSQWLEPFEVKPGPYVMLAVSNTALAVDAEGLTQLFEPCGVGSHGVSSLPLGVAVVQTIVKQSGGYMWVAGEAGRGTTFTICFPRIDPVTHRERSGTSASASLSGETLLLVEDEDGVRAVTRRFLESSGYRVLEAGDGAEALRICRSHPGRIDLVLTDVVMPRLSGPKLAERAALLHPEMRVLYISGYADRAIVANGLLPSESALLQKPFTRAALLSKVREMLHSRAPASGSRVARRL